MKVDLHLHTTASDGCYSPEELVRLAAKEGLRFIAITDHDSTDGIVAALRTANNYPELTVIPGVEISTDVPHGEVHILGYFIDYTNNGFQSTLESLRAARLERAQKMVAKLAGLGVHISWERVMDIAGSGAVGRPHIAQAMYENGYVPSIQGAFAEYIGREGPAYAEREKMTPLEAVELVVKVGGLPVLAHPAGIEGLGSLVMELKNVGLVGLEAYYDGYTPAVTGWLVRLAEKHELVPCGGSDFHGLAGGGGAGIGTVDVLEESARRLIALANKENLVVKQ